MTKPLEGPRSPRIENGRHGRLEQNLDRRLSATPHEGLFDMTTDPRIDHLGRSDREPDVPAAMKGMYYCG
jgi:hypothetical protein